MEITTSRPVHPRLHQDQAQGPNRSQSPEDAYDGPGAVTHRERAGETGADEAIDALK